ncbi:MAG: HDOD domain-containing protein [Pontibacterium sp.]
MSLHESPKDLTTWVEYLKDKPLPIRNSIRQRLNKAIHDDRTTLQSLGNLIKSDPVVCLHLVRAASELHSAKGSVVTGIKHAIDSLGFDRIERAVNEPPLIRLNAAAVSQKMFFRVTASSHQASVQVHEWLKGRKTLFSEESQLAALFYGIGHWMMWLCAPLHMSLIQEKIRLHHIDVVLAETDVLGCTLQEISHELAIEWQLPPLVAESLDHGTSPDHNIIDLMHRRALKDPSLSDDERKTLNHVVQKKCFPVKLANWITITSSFGWYLKKTRKLCLIISDFLHLDTADAMAMLHFNCVLSSRIYQVPGTLSPAAELLMIPSNLQPNYQVSLKEVQALAPDCPRPLIPDMPVQATAKPAKAAPAQPPAFKNETLFKQLCLALLKGSTRINNPTRVLQATVKTLSEGLGMERVILYRVQDEQMTSAIGLGLESTHPLKHYQFNLEIPSLFKRLSSKPGCLWISDDNRAQSLQALPECYQAFIPEQGAVLLSIFSGNKAVALIHADLGNSASALTEFHNKHARHLCSAAGRAMNHIREQQS